MNSSQQHRRLSAWLKHALLSTVGLALFAIVLYFSGSGDLQQLTHLRALPLVGAFIATFGIAASVALRWSTLTNALVGRPVTSWFHFCQYFLWNRMLGFVIPKDLSDLGGRTVALTARHSVPLRYAATSVLLDRAFDLLIVSLFLGPSLLFLSGIMEASIALVLMIVIALAFYVVLRLTHHPLLKLATWIYNHTSDLTHRVPFLRRLPLERVTKLDLSLTALSRAYFFAIAKFLCTVIRLTLFATALNMRVSPLVFLLGAPIGQLSFLFAFTPGGLGIFEAGWYAILAQVGVPDSYISPFLIEQRVFTTIFVGILALLSSLTGFPASRRETEGL